MQRSGLAGAAVAFGGSFVAACGSSESSSAGSTGGASTALKGKLAAQEFDLASIPNQQAFDALAAVGRVTGLKTVKLSYDQDSNKELAQIDQLGTLGVNAVETLIMDNGITRQIALACVRNDLYLSSRAQIGIWVIPCEPEIDWHYQGLATPPDGAYVNCVNMFEEIGGRGNFVHIEGPAGSATDAAKTRAVDRALKEYPNIELVGRQRADYNREKARVAMDTMLTSVAGRVDVVYCQNDDMALGALSSLKTRGLASKVLVSGADAIPEVVDLIERGEMFATEGMAPPFCAGYCLMQALDVANGHRPDPLEGTVQMDLMILDTPDAARAYRKVITRATSMLDYTKMSRVLHPDDWDPQWPIRTFEPEQFWTENQGIKKPGGYEIPEEYARRATPAGYDEINTMYEEHLTTAPFLEAARKSRTGKTAFEVVYGTSYTVAE